MSLVSPLFALGISPWLVNITFTFSTSGQFGIPPITFGGYELVIFFSLIFIGLVTLVLSEILRIPEQ